MYTLYSHKDDGELTVLVEMENGKVLSVLNRDLRMLTQDPELLLIWLKDDGITYADMYFYSVHIYGAPVTKITEVSDVTELMDIIRALHLLEI
jgi:predicted transcriptional regulator